jgi:hypothetical protein
MEKINKLSIPATILIAVIILGGFYFFVETNKQKSIERQQETKIAEEKRIEAEKIKKQKSEAFQKSLCVSEAEQNAIYSNKTRCDQGEIACIKGEGSYLVGQYENYYNICLQRYGLK